MNKIASILSSMIVCASLLLPAVAGDTLEDYQVIQFAQAGIKFFYGQGTSDGQIGDNWVVTNLTVSPFTLLGVQPDGKHGFKFCRDGWMEFGANPKWTATLKSKSTGKKTVLTISDSVAKTFRLGTNDYFVVDIRMAAQEVVLMPTNNSALITLHGVAGDAADHVE
jgi:hypothetical protein